MHKQRYSCTVVSRLTCCDVVTTSTKDYQLAYRSNDLARYNFLTGTSGKVNRASVQILASNSTILMLQLHSKYLTTPLTRFYEMKCRQG